MAKQTCVICNTKCVGCAGRCKCGMKDFQAKNSNSILSKNPERLQDKDKLSKLIQLVISGYPENSIIDSIEKNTEIKKSKSDKENLSGFCEYPVGSVSQGAWVKCVHCGLEKFYGMGKICSPKKEEVKEVKIAKQKKVKKTLSKEK